LYFDYGELFGRYVKRVGTLLNPRKETYSTQFYTMGTSPINDPDESTEGSDDENDADESPAPMSTRP
jgi:hypothetical protein